MTEDEKIVQKKLDFEKALDTILPYLRKQMPPLGNRTAAALIDEVGYVDELEKAAKKVKEVLKERIKSLHGGSLKDESADVFKIFTTDAERTALDQTKAKEYFAEKGILDDYMSTTKVTSTYIKRK